MITRDYLTPRTARCIFPNIAPVVSIGAPLVPFGWNKEGPRAGLSRGLSGVFDSKPGNVKSRAEPSAIALAIQRGASQEFHRCAPIGQPHRSVAPPPTRTGGCELRGVHVDRARCQHSSRGSAPRVRASMLYPSGVPAGPGLDGGPVVSPFCPTGGSLPEQGSIGVAGIYPPPRRFYGPRATRAATEAAASINTRAMTLNVRTVLVCASS